MPPESVNREKNEVERERRGKQKRKSREKKEVGEREKREQMRKSREYSTFVGRTGCLDECFVLHHPWPK